MHTQSVPLWSTQEPEPKELRPGKCTKRWAHFRQNPCRETWNLSSVDLESKCRHELGQTQYGPYTPFARRLLQSASPCSLVTVYDRKAVIKNADMSEEMQQDSVECATQALEKYNIEKDIAAHIKEFDKKYNPTWHCTMGRNFSSYVTHESKHFIYFYLDQLAILLFKSG
nr:dynein light chain 1, cytoplasmic-like [Odocoileus virginianus texanus]